jgi:hypothetical protein
MGETGTPVAYRASIIQVKSTRTIPDVADAACYTRNTGTSVNRISSALNGVVDGNSENYRASQKLRRLVQSVCRIFQDYSDASR